MGIFHCYVSLPEGTPFFWEINIWLFRLIFDLYINLPIFQLSFLSSTIHCGRFEAEISTTKLFFYPFFKFTLPGTTTLEHTVNLIIHALPPINAESLIGKEVFSCKGHVNLLWSFCFGNPFRPVYELLIVCETSFSSPTSPAFSKSSFKSPLPSSIEQWKKPLFFRVYNRGWQLPSYMGIVINHLIRIPTKQPVSSISSVSHCLLGVLRDSCNIIIS